MLGQRSLRLLRYINLPLHLSRRLLGLATYGRQEVLNHVIFPVADLPVTFDFLRLVVVIVDVEPRVVREVSESHLIKALEEHVIGRRLVRGVATSLLCMFLSILPHV